jgi:hypothetical protein
MQNFRLVEAARVIGGWRKASTVEEDNTSKNNIITNVNIFGLVGSPTGEQALAILKAKEDEKVAIVVADFAKKVQMKEKKIRDTTTLGTTGSDITKKL